MLDLLSRHTCSGGSASRSPRSRRWPACSSCLAGRIVAGAALLLLAGAATFAATLSQRQLFSARHYPEAGGILGSGFYAGVQWAAGAIGAALAIGLLLVLGLSLLTGMSFGSAFAALKTVGEKAVGLAQGLQERREKRPE